MSKSDTTKRKPGRPRTAQVVRSLKAAAKKIGVSSRTLHNWRAEGAPGFDADGTVDLAKLVPWAEDRLKAREGAADTKEEKLLEEIRKLRLANDAKEGRLVERAWVAERIQRMFGDVNAFRAKSEAEHAVKFAAAAGDIAQCRSIVRGVWDQIMTDLQTLKKHLEESHA